MKLLLTGAYKYTKSQLADLENVGFNIVYIQDEKISLEIDVSDIEAVVCNNLFQFSDIARFKNLKVIQTTSVGLERLPLEYIYEKKIQCYNAKDVYSIPIAEWVLLKVLEIYKKSKTFNELQNNHKWEKQRDIYELTEKVVAIIGFGSIGREIAKRFRVFGVFLIAVDCNFVDNSMVDEFYFSNDLNKVLAKSDIVILTLPLTNDTRQLINTNRLQMMKDKSVLVNVSRGDIIDEFALINALKNGKLLGSAIDVFKEEPLPKNSPLWDLKNLLITPHNSFISEKISERLFNKIFLNLKLFIKNLNNK